MMPLPWDNHLVTPLLVSLLIGWSIYRRARKSIGRQPVRPARIWIRIWILGVLGVLVLATSAGRPLSLEAMIGGLAGGIVLAFIGLRHTKFEATAEGRFYTPHTYIGLLVSALFVARIAYRFMGIYVAPRALTQPDNPFEQYQRSPLTLAVFGVLVGYYIVFSVGVLRNSRNVTVPDSATT
jgi:hypothetical protein